jgi:hypothetical protein
MALNATFTANFSSFYEAVDKATVKLDEFKGGAEKAGTRLNAMAQQFSGQKIVQEASLMVKAIGGVEGISKLTEKEIAKLAATTNEAVEKLKKLGKDVPKNLQDVADATKGANKASIDWMGSLTKMAGAIGIAFSVDAVMGFVGSVFDAASAIKDLGNQWGFTTDAVQEWKGAARDAGISTEALGKSILFVNEKVEEGSKEYDALLKNIGLSGEAMRKLSQEDAYKIILQKITDIKDATLQYDVALGLLGPSAKQTIGGIRDGLVEATAAQDKMSKETIARLAEAEDAWGKFKDNVIIYSGEMLSRTMEHSKALFSSWGNFFTIMGKGFKAQFTGGNDVQQYVDSLNAAATATTGLGAATVPVSSHTDDLNANIKKTGEVTDAVKKKEEARLAGLAAAKKALEEAKRAEEAYTRELKKHDDALDALVNSFGGAGGSGAIGKANDYIAALRMAIPIEQMSVKAKLDIHKAMDEAIVSYQAAGQMAPKVMYDIWLATKNATEGVIEFSSKWKNFAHLVNTQPIDLGAGVGMSLPPPKPGMFAGFAEGAVAAMAESMMKAIQGGGSVFGAASSTLVSYLLDPKQSGIGKAIQTQVNKLPKEIAGGINAVIPLIGPMIAPATAWLGDKIASFFGEAEHQKLRRSLIDAAGGYKALSEAAKDAGASLTNLYRARNTGQVEAEMRKLQEAIEFQATALDVVIETAERYGITLEELGPAMQRSELDKQAQQLFKDWEVLNAAGLDTIVITEKMGEEVSAYIQQAAKMGVEVPAAMRPMIEQMIEAGTLTDANGVAFEDLESSGISFSMTMTEGFNKLIASVEKLTEAIGRGLTNAIETVPALEVPASFVWHGVNIPNPAANSFAGGTGGFRDFGSGTPAMLHGVEAVVPIGQAGGLGGGMMTVIVEADGRQISRIVAPYLPGEVRRLGLARG